VKLVLSRDESVRLHPKRHPFELGYELGCDADGRLTALRATLVADTGAYASVGAKVVERAAGHACGPYHVPNVEVVAHAVYTNNPPSGAMRGFGVAQVAFAVEQLVDMLAERVGLDGYQMRERNLLRDGQRFGPGQRMRASAGLLGTLAAVKSHYYGARCAGLACGIKSVGIGNGMIDAGRARIDVLPGGALRLAHGMSEMGQGLHGALLQILGESTGLPVDDGVAVEVTTDDELDCGMTTASRGTVLIGRAVMDAAAKLRAALATVGGERGRLAGRSFAGEVAFEGTVRPDAGADDPVVHLSFGFAAQVAILDERTGRIRKIVAAHDVGRAINPMACEGQIEGAVHMGLGYALSEELRLEAGRPVAATVRELGVLRAADMPEVEVILVEEPDPLGPYGARGIGEVGMVPTAPAVAQALYRFDGRRRTRLPMRDGYQARRDRGSPLRDDCGSERLERSR
jgi:xanthine dehydrogenase molybdenum-binding subunit